MTEPETENGRNPDLARQLIPPTSLLVAVLGGSFAAGAASTLFGPGDFVSWASGFCVATLVIIVTFAGWRFFGGETDGRPA